MIVELASLFVSVASLVSSSLFGRNANRLANHTLEQAKEVAARSADDWRQQQWFLLYAEANFAAALLSKHHSVLAAQRSSSEIDESMRAAQVQLKRTHGLAKAFPACPEISMILEATSLNGVAQFGDRALLERLAHATDLLIGHAAVSPAVL